MKIMPVNWSKKSLSETGTLITGNTPPKKNSAYYDSEDIDFVKPNDLQNEIVHTCSEKLSEKARKVARIAPENTVLVTCIGNLGRMGLVKTEVAFNQQINGIIPNKIISSKFLFYRLMIEKKQMDTLSSATTVTILNKSNFGKIKITYPDSIEEQELIVAEIETQFTRLDSAIESLQRIEKKLEIYRKSVLKASFEGDYEIVKMSSFERKGGGTPSTKKKEYWEGKINWITSASIDSKNKIIFEKKITQLGLDNSSTNIVPAKSVLVVTRVGLGKVAVNEESTAFSQDIQGIFCKDINPYFLMWQIKSLANEIIIKGQGTTIKGITVNTLNNLSIKLPEKKVQQEIIRRIESKFSIIDKLEESVNTSLLKAETLRKSILKSAFEGKLVRYNDND